MLATIVCLLQYTGIDTCVTLHIIVCTNPTIISEKAALEYYLAY